MEFVGHNGTLWSGHIFLLLTIANSTMLKIQMLILLKIYQNVKILIKYLEINLQAA